jgi:hypothetical protein
MAKRGNVFHKNGARVLPPANDVEFECYNKLTDDGYTVIKSGYPDLFCFKDGKIVLIECKSKYNNTLKTNQKIMLSFFASYGIPCYKYTEGGKFEEIKPFYPYKRK